MRLRCSDEHQSSIHAFDVSDEAWQSLTERNRRASSAYALLRRPSGPQESKLGRRFFAHILKGECITAPETESHLRLKQMAVEAARSQGWDAEAEVSGLAPSGELWRADVPACKENDKVAVEIQWSSQTADETLWRQDRCQSARFCKLHFAGQLKFGVPPGVAGTARYGRPQPNVGMPPAGQIAPS